MPSTKEIRRRIKSIKATHQITHAMELVAAAKMRRAQQQALATRAYASLAWELLQNVSAKIHNTRIHKLLRRPPILKNIGIVLLTSNRGLIGGFNNNIIALALAFAQNKPNVNVEFITYGKKGREAVRKRGLLVAAEFEKKDIGVSVLDIRPMASLVINDFILGKYDQIVLVYMDFVSTLKQKPNIRELLPLTPVPDATLGEVGDLSRPPAADTFLEAFGEELRERSNQIDLDYLFEPSPDQVLEVLLPRLTEMQIYQAVLETNAAEHSARMMAMKNASEAAQDLISELTLEYNQARQAAITKEISEIVVGGLAFQRAR